MKNFLSVVSFVFFLMTNSTIGAQDTIPFNLGTDNRIYIKVAVNDSEPLDFIFDTGANGMVANITQTDKKLELVFDQEGENIGANGVSSQKVSTSNTLEIGNFRKTNQQLVGIAYPEEHYSFDGVIGYPFFDGYLIELDYEERNMILHKSVKTVAQLKGFEKLKMKMIGEVPFIDFTIIKDKKPVIFPAMIDTGFNGTLIVYYKIVSKKGLADHFERIRRTKSEGTDGTVMRSDLVLVPEASIGAREFVNVKANLNLSPSSMIFPAIIGGELLKKLRWVIDFEHNTAYISEYE